jgi:cytidylate kinase
MDRRMTNPLSRLTPPVSQRLQTWDGILRRLEQERVVKARPTVTLSRAFGCEGFPVAERLKTLLEARTGEPWNIYDKTLLDAAAAGGDVAEQVMKNLGVTAGRFERLGLAPKEFYEHVRAFDVLSRHIVHLAQGGNAILVGRGGAVLCKALENCFHFRIEASLEWRITTMMRRLDMPRHEAETFVTYNSERREAFMRDQLKVDPKDSSFFDATFNNARHGAPEIAAAIAAFVTEAWAHSPHAAQAPAP